MGNAYANYLAARERSIHVWRAIMEDAARASAKVAAVAESRAAVCRIRTWAAADSEARAAIVRAEDAALSDA